MSTTAAPTILRLLRPVVSWLRWALPQLEQLADLPAAEIQDGVPVSVVRLLGPM